MSRGFYINLSTPELKSELNKIKTYSESTQQKIRGVVKTSTSKVLAGTIRRAPIRKGDLIKKITMAFNDAKCEGEVIIKSSKAHLVEFGHKGPHPAPEHPFVRPSIQEEKPNLIRNVGEAVKP
jgi:hypothetical protein